MSLQNELQVVAVKIAFDHENGHIILEANVGREAGRAGKNIGHKFFRGQRKIALHYG